MRRPPRDFKPSSFANILTLSRQDRKVECCEKTQPKHETNLLCNVIMNVEREFQEKKLINFLDFDHIVVVVIVIDLPFLTDFSQWATLKVPRVKVSKGEE